MSSAAPPTPDEDSGDATKLTANDLTKKATRACTECHKAKCKCIFSSKQPKNQSKCDRCFRLHKVCVPHVSRQGKRKNANVKSVPAATSGSLGDGNFGGYYGGTPNTNQHRSGDMVQNVQNMQSELNTLFRLGQISASSRNDVISSAFHVGPFAPGSIGGDNASKSHDSIINTAQSVFGPGGQSNANSSASSSHNIAPSLPYSYHHEEHPTDNPLSSLLQNQAELASVHETNLISTRPGAILTPSPVPARGYAKSTIQSTTRHTLLPQTDTTHTATNDPLSSMTIPLREWMQGALDSTGLGVSSHNAPITPQYLACCLRIAQSLSRQISEAEEGSDELLRSLPSDVADWAEFVTVTLKLEEIVAPSGGLDFGINPSTHAPPADSELDAMEALLDSICEEDEMDSTACQNICFHNVISAEISVDICSRIDDDTIDHHSPREKQQRIYSLAWVFCELFSGGRFPEGMAALDAPRHPVAGFKRFDFASMVKLDEDEDEVYDSSTRKKPPRPQASLNSSIESFKQMGLPYPLCDLLYNMLDCINGDLSGNDSYKEMSDVTADLQLMIDEPSLFLHDLDVVTLSSSGLQLNDNLFMRDAELASLKHAYLRSISGSSELAIISGVSGTGKTHLAFQLGSHITSNGGIFLTVKFNQLKQANPISDIVSAFDDYCNIFMSMTDWNGVKSMASQLQDALGRDAHLLIKLIPKLSEILDCDTTDIAPNYDCAHGQEKILYLLIRFVEVMSDCSKASLTLFLDDLQWADAFALSVLQHMIMIPNEDKRFFFLGCYRADEVDDHHLFKRMLEKFLDNGIPLTMIQLDCMNKEKMQKMVSTLLHLSPRLVKGLSDIIYHKTKGNSLFVSRLLKSMNRDALLNLSLSRRRWVWDENLIKSIELPTDVASFFSSIICRLSPEVQAALQVLSCFGSVESFELLILEAKLGLELVKPLEFAVDEGFVNKNDDKYRFSHDKIQEAAYVMVPLEHRCLEHLEYGLCLIDVSVEKGNDCLLFTALGQVNLAGPSAVTDVTKSTEIAQHNLVAGKRAIGMSEFSCASRFFKSGISFLRENHWRDHYSLSLELFGLAAKCSLVLGDFTFLASMSQEIEKHAHCLDDKLDNVFVVMSSLANSSKVSESVQLGLSLLTQLGCGLPTTYSRDGTMSLIKQTQKDLSTMSDSTLLNYKRMTDRRHIMAMKCLAKLEFPTLQVSPELQPLVNLKMVEMTIDHGVCDSSPVGFAYFASMLARCGEMRAGYRFAKLAKALLGQFGLKESIGDVMFTTTEVISFFEPLHTVNEYRIQGEAAALAAGDVDFACLIRLSFCGTILRTGLDLLSVKDVFAQALRYMKRRNHLTSYYYLMPSYHSVFELLGETVSEPLTEDKLTNRHQVVIFHYQKMFLSLLLNIYDDMKRHGEVFFELRMSSWLLILSNVGHEFFGGLVAFRIYRETGNTLWLERGKQCKSSVQVWAEEGSRWNFEHKLFLLEAEEYYCCSDYIHAQGAYNNAIQSARAHKFINDEALACELAGYFYLSAGQTTESLEHLRWAYEKYAQWGACVKVNKILDFVQEAFGDVPISSSLKTNSWNDGLDSRKRK